MNKNDNNNDNHVDNIDIDIDDDVELLTCKECGDQDYEESGYIYKCFECKNQYCDLCNDHDQYHITQCTINNCHYCNRGWCVYNTLSERYCTECFIDLGKESSADWYFNYGNECVPSEDDGDNNNDNDDNGNNDDNNDGDNNDDDNDNNDDGDNNDKEEKETNQNFDLILKYLVNRNYSAIDKLCEMNITLVDNFEMTYGDKNNQCPICHDDNITCQINCGHMFCTYCYFKNRIVGSTICAICRCSLNNDLIILKS